MPAWLDGPSNPKVSVLTSLQFLTRFLFPSWDSQIPDSYWNQAEHLNTLSRLGHQRSLNSPVGSRSSKSHGSSRTRQSDVALSTRLLDIAGLQALVAANVDQHNNHYLVRGDTCCCRR